MKYYKLIFLLPVISLFLSSAPDHSGQGGSNRHKMPGRGNPGHGTAAYKVRLTYNGYRSLYGSSKDCQVGKNGKVTLSGQLSGFEDVDSDDDIIYTGTLQLEITNMDICSVKRLPNGEDKFCSITVKGAGPVDTELTLEFNGEGQDSARSAYIKINYHPKLGAFWKLVSGSCDTQQIDEERNMVPNETIASTFNGKDLPMLKTRTLRIGRYAERVDEGETVVEVLERIR